MSWPALERELDAWAASGRRATLWWRDDDATRDSQPLQRMLDIAARRQAPVAVAAVPADADASLAAAILQCPQATIVQHGYAHRNHAPPGERSAELGRHRPLGVRLDELAEGRGLLTRLFGSRFIPVLVPPWNRIADDTVAALASIELCGVSCFGARAAARPAVGLLQVNTHVDPIAWRRDRAFIGVDAAVERLVAHLCARRTGEVDAGEPTGLLTHHLVFSAAAWDFVDELCARLRHHAGAAWLGAPEVFAPPAATSGRSA